MFQTQTASSLLSFLLFSLRWQCQVIIPPYKPLSALMQLLRGERCFTPIVAPV